MKYELGIVNNGRHVPLEYPITVNNVVVTTPTKQSRDLITDIIIVSRYEHVTRLSSGKLHTYRSYDGYTSEGMEVGASVRTFKNEQYHELVWTPDIGTRLDKYNLTNEYMKYEGHY